MIKQRDYHICFFFNLAICHEDSLIHLCSKQILSPSTHIALPLFIYLIPVVEHISYYNSFFYRTVHTDHHSTVRFCDKMSLEIKVGQISNILGFSVIHKFIEVQFIYYKNHPFKIYYLVIFSVFLGLGNYHHNLMLEYFHDSQRDFCAHSHPSLNQMLIHFLSV